MTAALEISNLSVRIAKETILDDISFDVPRDKFLGILGPNGAGKSVLLKSILGEYKPCSGTIRIFGQTPENARGLVAYVPQFADFESAFPIGVRDVVLTGRLHQTRWMRRYAQHDRKVAEDALERMGIGDLADHPMEGLSGGQRQRVLIARALAVEAPLLLLDEPTASLDVSAAAELYELLGKLSDGCAIVLVTHDMGMVSRYVDQVACLSRRLIHHGAPEVAPEVLSQMYGQPFLPFVHDHSHDDQPHDSSPS